MKIEIINITKNEHLMLVRDNKSIFHRFLMPLELTCPPKRLKGFLKIDNFYLIFMKRSGVDITRYYSGSYIASSK